MEVDMAWLEEDDASAKTRTPKVPPFRPTMEVQMSWLEVEESPTRSVDPQAAPPPSSSAARKKPPRLPGARRTLPPMPLVPSPTQAPPPRKTMEVDMSWLELVDDKGSGAADTPTAKRSTRPPAADRAPARGRSLPPSRPPGRDEPSRPAAAPPPNVRPPRAPSKRPPSAAEPKAPSTRPQAVEELIKPRPKPHKPIPRED